jgi:DNA repair protein RadD
MKPLRDYQQRALDEVKQAAREGYRRMILQMPTGAGKTRLAAEIVAGAQGKKRKVIFEVPAITLIDQTVEAFYAEGIKDIGVIQSKHHMTDWSQPIQVASVQTLQNTDVPVADVVIRDEAHKIFKFDMEWMTRDAWRKVPFIGMTATPWTRGLGTVYEKLIIGATFKELIEKKVLAPFRVFAPSHPDLKGVRMVAGDYHEGELSKAMQKGKLVADIVETWKSLAGGRPTICFGVDRAHANALKERFEQAGVPAAYMDAHTNLYERSEIKRDCLAGRVKVVCNVEVMGFGADWPFISCISYCRPTKSRSGSSRTSGAGCAPARARRTCSYSTTATRTSGSAS